MNTNINKNEQRIYPLESDGDNKYIYKYRNCIYYQMGVGLMDLDNGKMLMNESKKFDITRTVIFPCDLQPTQVFTQIFNLKSCCSRDSLVYIYIYLQHQVYTPDNHILLFYKLDNSLSSRAIKGFTISLNSLFSASAMETNLDLPPLVLARSAIKKNINARTGMEEYEEVKLMFDDYYYPPMEGGKKGSRIWGFS